MGNKSWLTFISILLITIITITYTNCAGVGSIYGTSGNGIGVDDTEALSDSEADLYESDDSFSIPVTIAKLEAVDYDKVAVTYSSLDSVAELKKVLEADTGTSYYQVTGAAGSVNTDEAAYVMLLTETETEVVTVDVDGSFEASILANEGDPVVVLAINASQSKSSPPIFFQNEDSVTIFALTNTSYLNTWQVLRSNAGYMYFSLEIDGEYQIIRRKQNNGVLQIIATSLTSAPRVIDVNDASDVVFLTQAGKAYYAAFDDTAEETSWEAPEEILDLGDNLNDAQYGKPPSAGIYIYENDIFVLNFAVLSSTIEIEQDYLFHHYNTVTQELTEDISTNDYDKIRFAKGDSGKIHVFIRPVTNVANPNYELYQLYMDKGSAAWQERSFVYEHQLENEIVRFMSVSEDNTVLFTTYHTTDDMILFNKVRRGSPPKRFHSIELNGGNKYIQPWVMISPDSTYEELRAVSCHINETYPKQNHMVMMENVSGYFTNVYRLTNSQSNLACNGSYTLESNNEVLFYSAFYDKDGDSNSPQISIIKLEDLDVNNLSIDENAW